MLEWCNSRLPDKCEMPGESILLRVVTHAAWVGGVPVNTSIVSSKLRSPGSQELGHSDSNAERPSIS